MIIHLFFLAASVRSAPDGNFRPALAQRCSESLQLSSSYQMKYTRQWDNISEGDLEVHAEEVSLSCPGPVNNEDAFAHYLLYDIWQFAQDLGVQCAHWL
jgi:hypothetical protein